MPKRLQERTLAVVFGLLAWVIPFALLGSVVTLVEWRCDAIQRGERLEMTIARMPSGITAAESDRLIGSVPDKISQQSGVLVNSVTMLAASNSKATDYGPPQDYTLRQWKRGAVYATVVVDANGRVAGRWAGRRR